VGGDGSARRERREIQELGDLEHVPEGREHVVLRVASHIAAGRPFATFGDVAKDSGEAAGSGDI
jgi:hypothetical protein